MIEIKKFSGEELNKFIDKNYDSFQDSLGYFRMEYFVRVENDMNYIIALDTESEKIVGQLTYNYNYFNTISVAKPNQREGIATELIEEYISDITDYGVGFTIISGFSYDGENYIANKLLNSLEEFDIDYEIDNDGREAINILSRRQIQRYDASAEQMNAPSVNPNI